MSHLVLEYEGRVAEEFRRSGRKLRACLASRQFALPDQQRTFVHSGVGAMPVPSVAMRVLRAWVVVTFWGLAVEAYDWQSHPINEWVLQSPRSDAPIPPLKYEGSGALDSERGLWIHFGGHDGIPQGFALFTCRLDTGKWTQHFANTSPPGVCCIDGANTFDLAAQRFVAFPGASLGHGYQWSRSVKLKQSHVWLYDPQTDRWTNMRPPPYREPEKYSRETLGSLNAGATFSLRREVSIRFGGQTSGGPTNQLFVYDAYANQLVRLQPPTAPPERDGMGLCYDEEHDRLVMFGSQYGDDERTWLYDFNTNRWEGHMLVPHPPGRKEGTYATNPKLAYDSLHRICLCVVRRGESSGLANGTIETWALDVERMQWTRLDPRRRPDPSASRARNLSFWPEKNVFVLESVAADGHQPQLWTYRYAPAPEPPMLVPPRGLQAITRWESHSEGEPRTDRVRQVKLVWQPPDDGPVRQYRIYRAAAENCFSTQYALLATCTTTHYVDSPPLDSHLYFYRVSWLDDAGRESLMSFSARTQPPVPPAPVVSVRSTKRVDLQWLPVQTEDVAGYHVYRGEVWPHCVQKGTPQAWRDNDPQYDQPVMVGVRDIRNWIRLTGDPLPHTQWTDQTVDLAEPHEGSPPYRYSVFAYVVRAVNHWGVESGPSPYALTIPSAPQHVMLREDQGVAHLRWQPNPEQNIVGYHVYRLGESPWQVIRVTADPIPGTQFQEELGSRVSRYWVVAVDALGQQGEPSSAVWYNHSYQGFFEGPWHQ